MTGQNGLIRVGRSPNGPGSTDADQPADYTEFFFSLNPRSPEAQTKRLKKKKTKPNPTQRRFNKQNKCHQFISFTKPKHNQRSRSRKNADAEHEQKQ